eukprot:CAMPEP_0198722642 /NCGR_PEP_ID=MMETSP1475-20131203/291_1 /TAXON_ID= ORGANISM="Unidentified sp., Strain CCMP1999" /NCGR_SAMPLE_ID=MMETSP1475 /ASSEMBLY_ACC=CAM_ASM_001111 /LENGTH=297 /DNA_ID=CAMNT_0044483553 /DNA_START=105 /DNA_END=998 /DNA_ORIENTATION=+
MGLVLCHAVADTASGHKGNGARGLAVEPLSERVLGAQAVGEARQGQEQVRHLGCDCARVDGGHNAVDNNLSVHGVWVVPADARHQGGGSDLTLVSRCKLHDIADLGGTCSGELTVDGEVVALAELDRSLCRLDVHVACSGRALAVRPREDITVLASAREHLVARLELVHADARAVLQERFRVCWEAVSCFLRRALPLDDVLREAIAVVDVRALATFEAINKFAVVFAAIVLERIEVLNADPAFEAYGRDADSSLRDALVLGTWLLSSGKLAQGRHKHERQHSSLHLSSDAVSPAQQA